jgi:4-hydroxy-2-oxoheptanedioate aldolase
VSHVELGTVLSLPGAVLAELVARHLDFVWVDLEHGALGPAEMQDAIVGIQAAGARAHVRVGPGTSPSPALDAGADGIVFPRVTDAEHARAAVAALHHPPAGRRGYGPRREAVRERHGLPVCTVQIEDRAGIDAAHEIARVRGVDEIVVGAADLSFELGAPLEHDAPELTHAIAAVRGAAERTGARFGIAGLPPAAAIAGGAELVLHASDVRLIDSTFERMVKEAGDG